MLERGRDISPPTETRQGLPGLTLATSAIALVGDSANFGPTSPIEGQRYRLEAAPVLGSMNFIGVLADYRKYVMPAPFYTVAGRVMHYGRYGSDSGDARLYPLYINDPSLVHGYDSEAYVTDCENFDQNSCQATSPFVGTRMLVANLELRFPLLRPLGISQNMYGPIPTELAVFLDSGVAWTQTEAPRVFGGTRGGVAAAGVAVRMGLGLVAAEFSLTRPFQATRDRWVFGFNLLPGW